MNIPTELTDALEHHAIELPGETVERLARYAEAMWAINESLNLTRHTTFDLFVGRDIRDCVYLANVLEENEEILDLGSGNGVPGIPLAIMRPDVDVSLAESVDRKSVV